MVINLPAEMLNTFYDLTRVEYASLDKQLRGGIQAIDRQAAASGQLGSAIWLACEAGADSLAGRCRMAWAQLFKAMSAYAIKIDRDTGSLFLSELVSQAANSAITVKAIVEGCSVFRAGSPDNAKQAGMAIIEKALQHEVARMTAEMKLLIAASENMKPVSAPPSIAITGDGNVVIAGDGNQVNALTQIDTAAAKSLTDALRATLETSLRFLPTPLLTSPNSKRSSRRHSTRFRRQSQIRSRLSAQSRVSPRRLSSSRRSRRPTTPSSLLRRWRG